MVWLAEKRTAIATTRFALKLARDEDIDLDSFKQEAAIWVHASGHPNVVSLIEADIYDEQVVLVSEYIPDGSLATWLNQHGGKAPSIDSACEMIDGVLAGLAHLHEQRIIHRDLKPDNILLRRETPRLADFGIARLLRTGSYSTNISGTLAYMAPEAFDGKRNEKTDIWSAGVIFYQLLAGRLPYDQPDTPSFIGAIMRHDPPPLQNSIPEALRLVVMKALQRDPNHRYASAADMCKAIGAARRLMWLNEDEAREVSPTSRDDPDATLVMPVQETRLPPTIASPAGTGRQRDPEQTIKTPAPVPFIPQEIPFATAPSTKRRTILIAIASAIVIVIVIVTVALAAIWWNKAEQERAAKAKKDEEALKRFDKNYPATETSPNTTSTPSTSLSNVPPKSVTNQAGMELMWIQPGSFMMGSTSGDSDEKPVHQVTISQPFYIGRYEVTQAQWQQVMGDNPSAFKDCGGNCPVEYVSWDDAQNFINKLNESSDGFKYRLPTEAEWEYACRAGTTGDYAGDLSETAWYSENSGGKPHAVGQKQLNAWGLADMHGNVWEWCQDWYHETYYGAPSDGSAWLSGGEQKYRVLRGGSWSRVATVLRSPNRSWLTPDVRGGDLGLRVVAVR